MGPRWMGPRWMGPRVGRPESSPTHLAVNSTVATVSAQDMASLP